MVAGEITTQAKIDYEKVVRAVVAKIGFDSRRLFALKHIPCQEGCSPEWRLVQLGSSLLATALLENPVLSPRLRLLCCLD